MLLSVEMHKFTVTGEGAVHALQVSATVQCTSNKIKATIDCIFIYDSVLLFVTECNELSRGSAYLVIGLQGMLVCRSTSRTVTWQGIVDYHSRVHASCLVRACCIKL